jgi:uncharacterized membrane protein YozB (DUF420 family)
MKIGSLTLPNIKPQHAWILPLISLLGWWAMLVALMICWFAKGRPILDTDHYEMPHYIVYLSNVGATDLQPIFIVGAAIMGIFFVWAVIEDYYLRTPERNYFPASFHWFVTAIHALAIALAIIASLCILMVSCLKDNWQYSRVHSVFVILFVIFVFSYLCAHSLAFLIYYRHYGIKHFLYSAIVKIVWTCLAIVFVVCYGAFMGKANSEGRWSKYWGYSAIMEWTLVYYYGTMMFIIAWDLRRSSYGDYVEYYINREEDLRKNEEANMSSDHSTDANYNTDNVSNQQNWDNVDSNPFHAKANANVDASTEGVTTAAELDGELPPQPTIDKETLFRKYL